MRLKILWVAFSLSACSTVPLPHTDLCVANALGKHSTCYWVDSDFDDNGNVKPGAVPNLKPLNAIEDLNKAIWTDPDGWAELKAYIKQLRTELQSCGQSLSKQRDR